MASSREIPFLLARRRILILLDDALDEAQVGICSPATAGAGDRDEP